MVVVCEMRLVIAVHWRTGERESHTVVVVCEMRLVIAVHWRTGERERDREPHCGGGL